MDRNHPIFQIYIPDTLQNAIASQISSNRESNCSSSSLELYGLHDRIDAKSKNSKNTLRQRQRQMSSGDGPGPSRHLHQQNKTKGVLVSIIGFRNSPVSSNNGDGESTPTRSDEDDDDYESEGEDRLQAIGEIIFDDNTTEIRYNIPEDSSVWITLRFSTAKKTITVENITLDHLTLIPNQDSIIMIDYSPKSLKYAFILDLPHSGLPPTVIEGFGVRKTTIEGLVACVPELSSKSKVTDMYGDYEQNYFQQFEPDEESWNLRRRKPASNVIKDVLNRSMGIRQINYKMHLMMQIFTGRYSQLALTNLLIMLVIDALLGFYLTSYLNQFPYLYSTLHTKVEDLLAMLLRLLNWLKGSPAGLKLNAALNSLLWRFFSYHLHLWANYIGILEPILSFILSTIIMIGPLGFTLQIALMKDLLSMATFHVYCLYIYATRLFRVQIIATKSLCRLFLGFKWNPLRNRVDHINLSKSEMFISALLFTLAIFLAPTVITYYSVFLSLRLPVLIVESVLKTLLEIINRIRVLTYFYMIFHISRVCDEIYLVQKSTYPIHTFQIRFQCSRKIFSGSSKLGGEILEVLKHIFQGYVLTK